MRRLLPPLIVLGLAAAACGSTNTYPSSAATTSAQASVTAGGGGSATVNPCNLLTTDQISAALATTATSGKFDNTVGVPACSWGTVDTNNFSTVVVQFDKTSTSFDAAKQSNGQNGIQLRAVANLGQDAFFFGSGNGSLLEVKTAKGVLSVGVALRGSLPGIQKGTNADQDQAEQTLATEALTHL